MLFHDGMTPKLVKAGRVLVDSVKRGSFSLPPGQSREAARKAPARLTMGTKRPKRPKPRY